MKHRFLHTLVFSSVLALEGCASTPPLATDTQTGPAEASLEVEASGGAESTTSAANTHYVGSTRGINSGGGSSGNSGGSRAPEPAAPVEAAPLQADVAAMRACEVGWGTTKSGRRQVDPWDCSEVNVDGVERTVCTDASGRCLRP